MTKFRILLFVGLVALMFCIFWFDLYQYLTLDFYNEQRDFVQEYVRSNLFSSVIVFFLVYVSVTAISLPVGLMLSLSAGALFGVGVGTVVVSLASTLGATLACMVSRFLLQSYVDRHFAKVFHVINEGIRRDGPYYLFSLRLVPLFPYFVINLVMGLTHMPITTFAWVTQLGIIPITVVLTNAGAQLALVESAADIVSPALMGSLALVGVFPLIAKKLSDYIKARRNT